MLVLDDLDSFPGIKNHGGGFLFRSDIPELAHRTLAFGSLKNFVTNLISIKLNRFPHIKYLRKRIHTDCSRPQYELRVIAQLLLLVISFLAMPNKDDLLGIAYIYIKDRAQYSDARILAQYFGV